MPHVTIEYSANVAEVVDVAGLVDALHDAALTSGVVALDALRTRAVARSEYAIADRDAGNMFVAVTARLARGRTLDERRRLVELLMDTLDDRCGAARRTMMLSVECQEIEPEARINRNHLRPLVAARTGG